MNKPVTINKPKMYRYWRLIYSHIYKTLQNEEEAKDILQGTG
jgi:hypothetical protein